MTQSVPPGDERIESQELELHLGDNYGDWTGGSEERVLLTGS